MQPLGELHLRDAVAAEKEDLTRTTDALHAKEGSLRSRADLLTAARAQRSAALNAVNAEIAAEQKTEQELEQQSIALTNALANANNTQISHGSGAVSGSGLRWPVSVTEYLVPAALCGSWMVRVSETELGTAPPLPVQAVAIPDGVAQATTANGVTRSCATTTSETGALESSQRIRCSSLPCTT